MGSRFNRNEAGLNEKTLECLLTWLDADRLRAGEKYEEIRRRLIKLFLYRGCSRPEDLADDTIDRVIQKLSDSPDIASSYEGEPALYFYGVARYIYREYLKEKPEPVMLPIESSSEEHERQHQCLDQCLGELNNETRKFILAYYQEDKRHRIKRRQELAGELGVSAHALRMRACRLREELHKCLEECLERE